MCGHKFFVMQPLTPGFMALHKRSVILLRLELWSEKQSNQYQSLFMEDLVLEDSHEIKAVCVMMIIKM